MNIEYSFREEGDFHSIKLGLETRRDIYLVFKEAINNVAKYSRCTKVDIIFEGNDRQMDICVKDNGIGFCRDTIRNGNGLKNMEDRAARINGHLTIFSSHGSGTTVALLVKGLL